MLRQLLYNHTSVALAAFMADRYSASHYPIAYWQSAAVTHPVRNARHCTNHSLPFRKRPQPHPPLWLSCLSAVAPRQHMTVRSTGGGCFAGAGTCSRWGAATCTSRHRDATRVDHTPNLHVHRPGTAHSNPSDRLCLLAVLLLGTCPIVLLGCCARAGASSSCCDLKCLSRRG